MRPDARIARAEGISRNAVSPAPIAPATATAAIQRRGRVGSPKRTRRAIHDRDEGEPDEDGLGMSGEPLQREARRERRDAAPPPLLVAETLDQKERPGPQAEHRGVRIEDPRRRQGEGEREGDGAEARRARGRAELADPEPRAGDGQQQLERRDQGEDAGQGKHEREQRQGRERGRQAVRRERCPAAVPAVAQRQLAREPGLAHGLGPRQDHRRDVVQVRVVGRLRVRAQPRPGVLRVVERKDRGVGHPGPAARERRHEDERREGERRDRPPHECRGGGHAERGRRQDQEHREPDDHGGGGGLHPTKRPATTSTTR